MLGMDLQIPLLLDDAPVVVTCDFEGTLVHVVEDNHLEIDRIRYSIHQVLVALHADQDVEVHIFTDRTPTEDHEASPGVLDFCARAGVPVAELHCVESLAHKLSLMETLESTLHFDDDAEFVEEAAASGFKCILVVGNDAHKDGMGEDGVPEENLSKRRLLDTALEELQNTKDDGLSLVSPVYDDEDTDGSNVLDFMDLEGLTVLSQDDLINMLKSMNASEDQGQDLEKPKEATSPTSPLHIPSNTTLPSRTSKRSTAQSRWEARNEILAHPEHHAFAPLLDDVAELCITVNNIVHKFSHEGICAMCTSLVEGQHVDGCWVGDATDLLRAYTA